jgi:hypothetical protein
VLFDLFLDTVVDIERIVDEFTCQKCGKELHSDYNAARNIAHKFIQNRRKSGSGGATYHLALKSGTVNGNGDYSPSTVYWIACVLARQRFRLPGIVVSG